MNAVAQQTPQTETVHVTFMAKRFTFLALCVKHTAGHQHVGERDEIIHWWAAPLAVTWFFDVLLSEGNTFTMTPAPAVQILSVSFHASRRLTMASAFFSSVSNIVQHRFYNTRQKSHLSCIHVKIWLHLLCVFLIFLLSFLHSFISHSVICYFSLYIHDLGKYINLKKARFCQDCVSLWM